MSFKAAKGLILQFVNFELYLNPIICKKKLHLYSYSILSKLTCKQKLAVLNYEWFTMNTREVPLSATLLKASGNSTRHYPKLNQYEQKITNINFDNFYQIKCSGSRK